MVIRDAFFWLPLLGLYTGAREEELARLRVNDVLQVDGIWLFNITDEGVSRIKGGSAKRPVPLHSELFRLGFLAYRDEMAARGESQLFPDLEAMAVDGKFGPEFGEFFTRYRKKIGVYRKLLDFHSFRTSFITRLIRNGGVSILQIDQLTGHDSAARKEENLLLQAGLSKELLEARQKELAQLQSMSILHYYTGDVLKTLKAVVDYFDPGVDLSHLYP